MAKKIAPQGAADTQPALNKKEDFVLKYKNYLIGGVIAIVVIIAVVIFWNNHRFKKRSINFASHVNYCFLCYVY